MRVVLASVGLILALLVVAPTVLLWRAQVLGDSFARAARRTGTPMENALPSVLARIAGYSPFLAARARRQEARFWMTFARAGESAERTAGVTRRLSSRIGRAYSDAIRADAGFAAPTSVRALNRRSRFDLAGRKRGAVLERSLERELAMARWFGGDLPGTCSELEDGAMRRFDPARLAEQGSGSGGPLAARALRQAVIGHDERALALLDQAPPSPALDHVRGLILLRRGDAAQAVEAFSRAAGPHARTGQALAHLGSDRPDDALLAIAIDPGHPPFAMVRLIASFVTGDTSGARVALTRIADATALAPLRDALEAPLVSWSVGKRREGRVALAREVASAPDFWDFLLPLARYAAGRSDDVDAWIELAAPKRFLDRVWQLYALERVARERGNTERADKMRLQRRAVCR